MEFSWISIAVLSAASLGLVNILDSHLISKRLPSLKAFMLAVSPFVLFFGLLFAFLFPLPAGLSAWQIAVAIAAWVIRTASVSLLLYSLRREEVSRAVPVVSTYPVFVIIMAVPLLGETLNYLQGLAIAAVVIGVVLISVRRSTGNSTSRLGTTFFLLIGSSLLMAMADVTSKYALTYISFWNMYWISILSLVSVFLLISFRRRVVKELFSIVNPYPTLVLVTFNELLVVASSIMLFWAMERGPVSLVSTIASTRPVFVVIYALILKRFWPRFLMEGELGRGALAVRLIATAMIAGGIVIIYLA